MSILSPMPIGECMISTEIATLSSISAALSSKQDTLADAQIYAIDSVVSARATEMVFDDGAVSAFNWVGEIDWHTMVDAGLRIASYVNWRRKPVVVRIGDTVTSLGYSPFYGCTKLESITIPESVTSIGEDAFNSCTKLESITIPKSATNIGKNAFYTCTKLSSITIQESVTSISEGAFGYCTNLSNILIPESMMSIGINAFTHCTNLTSLVFKGKSKEQVEAMPNYPWGINNTSIISTWNDASQEWVDSKLSGYVPTSRTINSKALSSDLTLNATDVGALSSSGDATLKAPFPYPASLTIEGAPAGGGKLVIGGGSSAGDWPAQIVLGKQDGEANHGANITLYGAYSGGQDGASINLVDNPNADVRPQLKSEITIGDVKVRESIGKLQNSITTLESTVGQANTTLEEIA